MGALDGIKVLDFGRFIAGPYCGALLADLGADVLRIERVEGGEDRFLVPVTPDGVGALFLQCNRGKRCLTLDLASPEGREVVRRLVAGADVVIANLPLRALTALGLDHASLSAVNPRIIAVLLSAWGTGGEWSDRIGFDSLAQATSGAMHLTGPEGQPTRSSVPYVDFSTATLAALGAVAALRHRDLTGEGQLVEGSLFATAVAWNSQMLIEQAVLGTGRRSTHNRSQTTGPSDTFRTRDGWVMVAVAGPGQFAHWCELIERPDLVDDPRFRDDAARGDHGALLTTYMAAWCADRTTAACTAAMETHRIPGGAVLSPAEVLELPHLQQTGLLARVDHPGMDGDVPLVRAPLRLSVTPTEIRGRAPQLGEHREQVLAELGYSAQEISRLVAARVV